MADRVEIVLGRAADSLTNMVDTGTEPFDLVFIDADKESNPLYLEAGSPAQPPRNSDPHRQHGARRSGAPAGSPKIKPLWARAS